MTTTHAPLQCQREAARFATRDLPVDEVRRRTNAEALELIVAGDREGALEVMFAGLKRQCPLTFNPKELTR